MSEQKKKAFITGITGQDGSYLAEFLLSKGYEVHGLVRRSSTLNRERIDHLAQEEEKDGHGIVLHYGDITDASSLTSVIERVRPDEIYNLAAQSHVGISFEMPAYTFEVIALGTLKLLEAIRASGLKAKLYQASSSEMYGNAPAPQSEKTPFRPASPYAIAKLAAHNFAEDYRETYGIFACSGILFNHESPRRGENFVTRKITTGVARIMAGKQNTITLGNLEARRDWGYAPEYVEAMRLMLQQERPDDYVIATGETHSVREFAREAFRLVGITDWEKYIERSDRYARPREVHLLVGDAKKARDLLRWEPKVRFQELVKIMLSADLEKQGVRQSLV